MTKRNYFKPRTTLKLDIDKKFISYRMVDKIRSIVAFFRLDVLDVRISKSSSGNHHIEIDLLNEIDDCNIVFLQLSMGSDSKREYFNMLRVCSGNFPNQSWNVLFKKKFNLVLK